MKKRLVSETDAIKTEMINLDKKEHYLQQTYDNSKSSLEQVLARGGR